MSYLVHAKDAQERLDAAMRELRAANDKLARAAASAPPESDSDEQSIEDDLLDQADVVSEAVSQLETVGTALARRLSQEGVGGAGDH